MPIFNKYLGRISLINVICEAESDNRCATSGFTCATWSYSSPLWSQINFSGAGEDPSNNRRIITMLMFNNNLSRRPFIDVLCEAESDSRWTKFDKHARLETTQDHLDHKLILFAVQ